MEEYTVCVCVWSGCALVKRLNVKETALRSEKKHAMGKRGTKKHTHLCVYQKASKKERERPVLVLLCVVSS